MTTEFKHIPVMPEEVIKHLNVVEGGTYLDCTLGGGGHSEMVLKLLNGTGRLYGIDRDLEAISFAKERLKGYKNFTAIHGNFHDVISLLPQNTALNGTMIDLGVSSYQLDNPKRGFSYHEDAPLDMRMDGSKGITAAEYLNTAPEDEIAETIFIYSDERWAKRIAQKITEKRKTTPLKTTQDLVNCIDAAIPKAVRRKAEGHPAKRTFQAIRIKINGELDNLETALNDIINLTVHGGRLCVITFHSIEDRLVKRAFQKMQSPCICPPAAPICVCGRKPIAKNVFSKVITPSDEELQLNSRSRSAKLRVVGKI
ncbi:MAG: 16S rRNA (cytosine(1402)-N(4))-methyltransferase RsmH [Eubacteriales bacterium]|nr:16S rRNA (cytosine(1402)-N(4))-methyltransferase RsmH [Eubacteriales bacterium]